MDGTEGWEDTVLNIAQMLTIYYAVSSKCEKLSKEADESRVKISKLTQDLKEVQSEANLGKVNLKIAKKLVEQAKQEKYIVELKSARKIQELETELQQLKDNCKDARLDAKVHMQ